MITCSRFENCKVIGVVPKRVRKGYGPCRHKGIIPNGKREGETCYFVTFPDVDLEQANRDILAGNTRAHRIARERRSSLSLFKEKPEIYRGVEETTDDY